MCQLWKYIFTVMITFIRCFNQIKLKHRDRNALMLPNCNDLLLSWWRHQMETFSGLLALCARNSPVSGEFPSQRPVTRSFDVFFDLRLNRRLSKQSWGWWLETPSGLLWSHCNDFFQTATMSQGRGLAFGSWMVLLALITGKQFQLRWRHYMDTLTASLALFWVK